MNSWSKRLLSYGGKDVFIKSVLQSIPTYAFSVFLAPKGVIEELHSKTSHVWWGGNEKNCCWSMLVWNRVCFPKGMGGLGFRDLHLFNIALLGRQVWRLISCKDTLCYRVLCAKYFPNSNIFHTKRINKSSYIWSSISAGARHLNNGFGWIMGDGRSIDFRRDNWGFEGLTGELVHPNAPNISESRVWFMEQR